MTWDQVVSKDLAQRGIQPGLAQDRLRWKSAISKLVEPMSTWKNPQNNFLT